MAPPRGLPNSMIESPRSRQIRARRLRVDALKLGPLTAQFLHARLGAGEGTVEDLSLHGMALVLPAVANQSQIVFTGDRLDQVIVQSDQSVLYRGAAVVRRVTDRGSDLVCGIELESSGIDLSQLYRHGTRVNFATRWDTAKRQAEYPHIASEFKVWIADLRAYFDVISRFLRTEEEELETEDLKTADQSMREYLEQVAPALSHRMSEARGQMALLVNHLSDEQHAAYRAFTRMHLGEFLLQSPFMRRAFEKPLGYAGDYEMMNMLYRDPAEGRTLLGKAVNIWAVNEVPAVANKNRVTFIGNLIHSALASHRRGRIRIASVGCGPAREISALLEEHPEVGSRIDVTLIDQDERAIAYCERTLAPLAAMTDARIRFVRESLRTLLVVSQRSLALGECELIYSAGLFDYLSDRAFGALLNTLYSSLAPRGLLAVGNVASHNPSRWFMEYFLEWFLIHRSRGELLDLSSDLRPKPTNTEVGAEPSGVNFFLLVQR